MYKYFFKRLIDIVLSIVGIVVLAIPMLIIAVAIKIDSSGPIIFRQKRMGIHKKTFTIFKFRSMPVTVPHDIPTDRFRSEDSLSKFQKIIRKFSIDELPQIYNIFLGTMSIIGPRPALTNQEDLILERDKYGANDVKPGLTGWAQINGRDEIPIHIKAELDGEYVRKMSFIFDCKCFFGTIFKVLKHEGVVEGGMAEISIEEREKVQ